MPTQVDGFANFHPGADASPPPRVAPGEDRDREGRGCLMDQVDRDGRRGDLAFGRRARPEERDGDQLPARVVAGLEPDARVAGLLKGERPTLSQVVVGRRVDLGGEAGEPEDGWVGQVDDLRLWRAKPGKTLRVDEWLRDCPARSQQAPELLHEGANRLLGEVAGAGLGEIEPAVWADIEEPGSGVGRMDAPQGLRSELRAGELGEFVWGRGKAARRQRFNSATAR